MKNYAFLLADPSPLLRYILLSHMYDSHENKIEISELENDLENDPLLKSLIEHQNPDGSWNTCGSPFHDKSDPLITTSLALLRLNFLGIKNKLQMTEKAVEFLFSKQQKNGCWRTKNENIDKDSEGYDWIPAQTALPLTGIAAAGYGEDPRAQEAYKWLFEKQLDEGTWPAGWKNGTYGYIAGYRKMPHSRWGCRTNTTAVLMSLAYNQKLAQSDKAKSALDLLLARESQDLHNLGFNLARILGFEPIKGLFTFFAKFDPLLSLMLAKKIGADLNDERVVKLYGFIKSALNENNLFEYKSRPQASRWISYGILKTLKDFPQDTGWQSNQFTTPFRTYGKKEQRY